MRNEVVVITGASAGVGRAAARAFGKRGAHVGLLARGRDGLEGARREIESYGGKALAIPTDVADAKQLEDAAKAVEKKFGSIDIWVNNAMVSVFSEFREMTPDEFKRVTEVTYLGSVYGTMSALRRMLPRDQGAIVQVGSALAYRSIPLQSAYCGAKSGIRGFLDSVRCELIHNGSNVRIAMVQMPALNTPQFSWVKSHLPRKPQPVPPIYEPEVAAEAVVWAAHHDRREMYVGLSTMLAILGNKIAPEIFDHYLGRTGYHAQQYDGAADPKRPNNLWKPLCGDHGAHGDFDNRASDHSVQLWLDTKRTWLLLAGIGLGAAIYEGVKRAGADRREELRKAA